MKEGFRIEEAKPKDYKEILELIGKEFSYFSPSMEELKQRLETKLIVVFTASQGEKLAGFIELEIIDVNEARVNGLTVKEEFRGKEAAKTLLSHAINYLKEQGIERVFLLVKQSNEAAKTLYKQFGFGFIGLYHKQLEGEIVEKMELSLIEEME